MRIGVDLGGTKIEAIALDDAGAVRCRRRIATPAGNYGGTLSAIAELVFAVEREIKATGSVGVATPGSLSLKTGLIRNSNSTVLNGRPLDRDISRILERPVRIENDANCFALSEAIDGAAKDAESVFGVILGTGVGGGLTVRKRLVVGRNRIAGEWGHNPMPWPEPDESPGQRCYCGQSGCIETFLSGPAISRQFRAATSRELSAQQIARDAEAGDEQARAVIEKFEERLARALAHVVNIFDPDVIVLGGGLSNIERIYRTLPRLIPIHVFSDAFDTPIVPPLHGDSSGVRGAAWLWPQSSGERDQ
ncbi:MAG: ROK family protein [Candidatus Binataceae bacterium]